MRPWLGDESIWPLLGRALVRGGLLALVWAALVEGNPAATWAGVLAVPAAAAVSLVLLPDTGLAFRPAGLARFLPSFLWMSLQGSVAVAATALDPRLPLRPRLIEYPLGLRGDLARALFVGALSLTPGTLGVDVRGDVLLLHLLDGSPDGQARALESLRGLERLVAGLFEDERP